MLTFPQIDPVLIEIGPLAIRWYSLAYVAGIMLGWWLLAHEHKKRSITGLNKKALDDLILWAVIGIIAGGRLGYVLFYQPAYFLNHPLQILYIWQGGMSFHGGLLGVIAAFWLFCKKHGVRFLALMDVVACAAPIGLFFGRIANFINGELWGRVTDSPFGMVFPNGGPEPRHPSQLYEAATEGLLLFMVLFIALKYTTARNNEGLLAGLFLVGYALARSSMEQFREPDAMIGFITIGQLLSLPMAVLGLYLIFRAKRKNTA